MEMMTMIRTFCALAAAAGLVLAYSGCERHSYEVTSKLQHHGDHGEGEGHGEEGHDADHGADKHGKSGDKGHEKGKKEKAEEKGRKVF